MDYMLCDLLKLPLTERLSIIEKTLACQLSQSDKTVTHPLESLMSEKLADSI